MVELIYRDSQKYNIDLEEYGRGSRCIESAAAVFASENKVSSTESELMTGINRHSGKRWYRWQFNGSYGIYRNHKGNIVAYHRTRTKRMVGTGPVWSIMDNGARLWWNRQNEKRMESFRTSVRERLGIESYLDVYPMAKWYETPNYSSIPPELSHAFRNDNMRAFVTEAFGKKTVRKDLIRTAAQTSPSVVALGREFRGLVPVDWIVELFANHEGHGRFDQMRVGGLRQLLLAIDQRSLRHLIREPLDGNNVLGIYNISAQMRMPRNEILGNLDNGRVFRSWQELHDTTIGYRARRTYLPFVEQEIELVPLAEKLDGLSVGGLTIAPAKHTEEMVAWGESMRNCIAGYRRSAASGHAIYAAVYNGEKLRANLEIIDGKLVQLLGKANSVLPESERKSITSALKKAGVSVPRNYWGSGLTAW